jgi:hypothetical protein
MRAVTADLVAADRVDAESAHALRVAVAGVAEGERSERLDGRAELFGLHARRVAGDQDAQSENDEQQCLTHRSFLPKTEVTSTAHPTGNRKPSLRGSKTSAFRQLRDEGRPGRAAQHGEPKITSPSPPSDADNSSSTFTDMWRASLSIVVTSAGLFLACSSGSTPSPQSPPTGAAAAGCGLNMHPMQPRCEAQLDAQCCAQQQACANDADCQQAIACIVACDAEVAEKRKAGKSDACACFPRCVQQIQQRPGAAPFFQLVRCTQTGFEGMSCGSQC